MPRFSIVIPTHNRAQWLSAAVDSVLAQHHGDFELIVVDDGSTDSTQAVLAAYADDSRVRLVRQANAGRSEARNHGARLAQGDGLGFLDSDDCYLPDALAAHAASLTQQPALGLLVGGYTYVDAAGQPIADRRPWEEGPLTLAGWMFNCYGIPGAILVKRWWFENAGGFDAACEIAEDWDLFLRLARAECPTAWTRATVCQYRQHGGNSIVSLDQHFQGTQLALDKLLAQPNLPPEISAEAPQARAWIHVVFARRAILANSSESARAHLAQAIQLYPPFAGRRRVELLEALIAPSSDPSQRSTALIALLGGALPKALGATSKEVRRASARIEMAQFFRLAQAGRSGAARRHLLSGLRLDPSWLANRGTLSFLVRQAWRP